MERVTHIDKDGWYINGSNVAAVFHSGTGEIRMSGKDIDRLAAYEDTGLEPEDFKRAFNEDAVLKLAGQVLSVTPDRLRELAKADKEGQHIPAADVEEVRHGKFNFLQEDMVWCYCGVCSVCRNYVQAWNYCPNCGARMDKEDEHEDG